MQVSITVRVLRTESREGDYLDKVSGKSRHYSVTKLFACDSQGYTGVFTWVSDKPAPQQGDDVTLLLRKFEDTPTGATGIAVEYAQ